MDERNCFLGQLADLDQVEVDSSIGESLRSGDFNFFASRFQSQCDVEAVPLKHVYGFLYALCSFHPQYESPKDPYGPMWRDGTHRTMVPQDLTDCDLQAVKILAGKTKISALKGLLHDILWIRGRTPDDAKQACVSFLTAAEDCCTGTAVLAAASYSRRAYDLARVLGTRQPLFKTTLERLLAVVKYLTRDHPHQAAELAELLLPAPGLDIEDLASSFQRLSESTREPTVVRSFRLAEQKCWKKLGEADKAEVAAIQAAEALVSEAQARALGPNGSFGAAAEILKEAILELRKLGETARIRTLEVTLTEWQGASLTEISRFSRPISLQLTPIEEFLAGLSLPDALHWLCDRPLYTPTEMKSEARSSLENFPLTSLIKTKALDTRGRTTPTS